MDSATRVSRILLFVIIDTSFSLAQPGPLTTLQNSELYFAAADLTTNGVPGLTNTAPHLMVSAVADRSTEGGQIALVSTQAWIRSYNGPANSFDQALRVALDTAGNDLIAGYSLGPGTENDFAVLKYARDRSALWTNRYDGPVHKRDYARDLASDRLGNVYVAGDSENSSTGKDVATIKYLPDVTPMWTNRFSSSALDYFATVRLAVTLDGL
jgi:hypothetical protein